MKLFLQEHLNEKLRNELEAIALKSAAVSLLVIAVFQFPALPQMRQDSNYMLFTGALSLTYLFRFFLPKFQSLSNRRWLLLHSVTILLHSTFWSLALLEVARTTNDHELRTMTYLLLSGLLASASYTFSFSKIDFYLFIVPILSAQILAITCNFEQIHFKLSSVLIVMLFFLFLAYEQRRIGQGWIEQRTQNFELQNIIDAVPGGIAVLKGTVYARVNKYIRNMAPVNLIGHEIGTVWSSNPEYTEKIKSFIHSTEKRTQYEVVMHVQGEQRAYLVTAMKSFNSETVISTIDIEDIKKVEREINEQKNRLEQNSKMAALGEMAGGMAHEINNPVAIISGRAQQLMMSLNKDTATKENLLKGLESINMTSQRINRIVRGLRSVSHDTTDEPYLPSSIRAIVEETLTFCEAKFRNDGIRLSYEIPEALVANCSSTQISQVLLNALNNSHDAIVESINPDKWILIHATGDDTEIKICITDSGPGIPVNIREKIMQPFFSTKAVGHGTGLGLSISKGIVESHRGQFYFNYENTANTQLVIVLPVNSNT